jgi:acetoin:2,6-dichlorophenolindophenol oxidoreductase subunit alpha
MPATTDTLNGLDRDTLRQCYRRMAEIRAFEDQAFYLFSTEPMPGALHQCNGQEAVCVGVCENLHRDDYVTSTHRGHGHCIAKGADINRMMAELFARDTGSCRGMGGSMHLADFSVGMLGAVAIVGGGIPLAVGAALSAKLRGTKQVAVSFFGDGAINEGSFHESINLAAADKLPVVFVCENNLYGFSTHIGRVVANDQLWQRAAGYGVPGERVDGNDLLAVHAAARTAVDRARRGAGPTLLECLTYRHRGHSRFEQPTYRTREEEAEWKQRDPIPAFAARLLAAGLATRAELNALDAAAKQVLEDAVEFARQSPPARPELAVSLAFTEPS